MENVSIHDPVDVHFISQDSTKGKCALCRHDTKMIPRYGGVCYRCWSDVEFYHYYDWKSGKPQWSKIG